MKIIRSDMPIEVTILLILLTILLAIVVIPLLLVIGVCWLVRRIVTGVSSDGLRPGGNGYRSDRTDEDDEGPASSASGDDTIDCEVISARTFDENGQEIR